MRLPSNRSLGSAGTLALISANVVPLVGVVAWGWDQFALLTVYWIEASTTVFLGALKALFAVKGSPDVAGQIDPLHELREKRGGFEIRPGWPSVYPRNVPFAVSMISTWVLLVGVPGVLYWAVSDMSIDVTVEIALAMGALLVAHAGSFITEYIGTGAYAEVSARDILQTPARLILMLVPLAFFVLIGDGLESVFVVLAGFVVAKTILSVSQSSTGPIGRGLRRLIDRLAADRETQQEQPEISLPDAPVESRVTVSVCPVLLGSLPAIALAFMNRAVGFVILATATTIGVGYPLLGGVGVFILLWVAGAQVASYVLRYGTIEYQRRGDSLVAYDTVLEAPQWIVPIYSTATFEIRNAIPDRLLGTGTLTISNVDDTPSGSIQFGPVADLESAIETLDLPVSPEDRPERDPAVIAAASGLAACFGLVPLALILSSSVSGTEAAGILLAFGPFLLLPIGLMAFAALSRV